MSCNQAQIWAMVFTEIIKSKKISLKKRQEEFGFRIIKDHKFCIQATRHQEDVNRLAAVQKQRVAKVQVARQLAKQQEEVIRLAAKEEAAIVAARQLVEQQEREREQEENAAIVAAQQLVEQQERELSLIHI